MAFEKSAVIVPLYKDKGERTECKLLSLLSMVPRAVVLNMRYLYPQGVCNLKPGGTRHDSHCNGTVYLL